MLRLDILSGAKAGTQFVTRLYPVEIGRGPQCQIQLTDPGVWDRHVRVSLDDTREFVATALSDALVSVDGQPAAKSTPLRNGDTIEIGSVRIRFQLSETRHRGLKTLELAVWTLILLICAAQISIIYLLAD